MAQGPGEEGRVLQAEGTVCAEMRRNIQDNTGRMVKRWCVEGRTGIRESRGQEVENLKDRG